MNILGKSSITYKQLETWVKSVKTANPLLLKNLPIIWKCANNNGILIEVFVAQICVETGYFNFGGVLNASFHNTCGLKTTKGGGDYVANAHMRFKTWEEGIQAHADHLALYAGASKFPKYSPNTKGHENTKYKANGTTLDPRHFPYLYGKCRTVESLEGKWATGKGYAKKLLSIINKIKSTTVAADKPTNKNYANGAYNRKAKVIANTGLNVRKGRPGSKEYNTILEVLKKGTIIEVNYCLDGWFSIYTNKSKPGYISGQYIEFI